MAFRARNPFNDTMSDLVGGVGSGNRIVAELTAVQQMLSAADREATNPRLHTHNSIDQLLQDVATVQAANSPTGTPTAGRHVGPAIDPIHSDIIDFAGRHAGVEATHQFFHGDFAEVIQLIRTHAHDASTHDLTPSQPVQPPTQTQTADPVTHDVPSSQPVQPPTQTQTADPVTHDVPPSRPVQPPTQTPTADPVTHDAPPSQPVHPPTSQPVSLTHTTTAIHSSYDGQVIENLDIYVDNGDALTITNDNVTLRNVRVHHAEGNGVVVSGANNVTIENVEVINSSPPTGNQDETNDNITNILVADSPNVTVHNATLRGGSDGLYLVNSPGANISHVDGYDQHGPFPRGHFVEFNNSGNSTLTDFYVLNPATTSAPQDNVSAFNSPNVTISNGVIDGNNSTAGVGIMFEVGSTGGRVNNVDAIHMGNGAFSTWDTASNVVFDHVRSFDNIYADQGRGPSASDATIFVANSPGVSFLNATYTNAANLNNVMWQGQPATVADVHEAPNATPMEHIVNHYAWS
jgi:hypothetical protein